MVRGRYPQLAGDPEQSDAHGRLGEDHRARGHGRLLRRRRGAAKSCATRSAARGRRRSQGGTRPRRRDGGELRGSTERPPLGPADLAILEPLRIRVIPGIGPTTERFLHERHIRTVADLRTLERAQLEEWFGRWGEDLFAKARGLSESAVSNERERKSVGEQETFEVDTLDAAFVLERARALAHTVWSRLEGHGFRAFRTVTVTVRFENFMTFARSRTGREAWASQEALCAAALELLVPFLDDRENPRHRKLRLIGVRAEKLSR